MFKTLTQYRCQVMCLTTLVVGCFQLFAGVTTGVAPNDSDHDVYYTSPTIGTVYSNSFYYEEERTEEDDRLCKRMGNTFGYELLLPYTLPYFPLHIHTPVALGSTDHQSYAMSRAVQVLRL